MYSVDRPTLSLGAFHQPEEVNLKEAKNHKFSVIRRSTGGPLLLHQPGDLLYSAAIPIKEYHYSVASSSRAVLTAILNTFKKFKVQAILTSKNELMHDEGHLVRYASSTLNNGIYIQQGTIHLAPLPKKQELLPKNIPITSLHYMDMTKEQLMHELQKAIGKDKQLSHSVITKKEQDYASQLADLFYSKLRRPPRNALGWADRRLSASKFSSKKEVLLSSLNSISIILQYCE